jgi:hypothetical protein
MQASLRLIVLVSIDLKGQAHANWRMGQSAHLRVQVITRDLHLISSSLISTFWKHKQQAAHS